MSEASETGGARPPVFAVLLAGGKGTRFWPASRASRPKQFLRLIGERSLLRETWDRVTRILPVDRILVVTSPPYAEATRQELPELNPGNLLLEPSGRDTAPAIALAVREVRARASDALTLIAPTDHHVEDEAAFARSIEAGLAAAAGGSLVTFGIVPAGPATVYGYIEVASRTTSVSALPVVRFHEKPDLETARGYLATGRFLWNAGVFVWSASLFQSELAEASPELAAAITALPPSVPCESGGYPAFAAAWEKLPSISIDYALLEKAHGVKVVPLEAGWSDIGGWDALRDLLPADGTGNRPSEGVLYVGSRRSMVFRQGAGDRAPAGSRDRTRPIANPPRAYALVGVEGLIVVETEDAVLICREGAGEDLREVVKRWRASGREDLL